MSDTKRRMLGMVIPFGVAFLPDTALAIFGSGPFEVADTFFFHALYVVHPWAVLAGYVAWAAVIIGLLLLLPEALAVILTIAVVFGHVAGAYTQSMPMLGTGWYQIANGSFLAAAVLAGTGLWWSARASATAQDRTGADFLPAWLRWCLIVALLGAACCMIFIPRQT
jgi:hypothetical protein